MLKRSAAVFVLLLMVATILPAAAVQMNVAVVSQGFSWTGKQNQQARYDWRASVRNPSRRTVTVTATLQLLDNSGAVVSSDRESITIDRESAASVNGSGEVAYSSAQRATQYRVDLVQQE